jgi:ABC-2 type transport system permease protein
MARNVLASPIRVSAFLGKEIYEVLRQPRLILTLALGPFLILLLFGIGFRDESRPFRTLFVAPQEGTLAEQVEEFGTTLGPQLVYAGTTASQPDALGQLRRGEVDLVILVPHDAEERVRNNEQAVLTLYHNEINPMEEGYVEYFGQIYVGEVNRRILQRITETGQAEATTIQDDIAAARTNAAALRSALEAGDAVAAQRHQGSLDRDLTALEIGIGASLGVLRGVEQTLGNQTEESSSEEIAAGLAGLRQGSMDLSNIQTGQASYSAEARRAAEMEQQLAELDEMLAEFTSISPHVLVSPFRSEARSVTNLQLDITHFYAPGVLALLLQHLAVTFGALSVVRERQTNTVELFRVAPITAGEILIGKYISYMLFGGLLATILTLLLIFVMRVPVLGAWWNYVIVLGLLLFASLGIGFVISLVSHSDSQAVQLAMLVLLASVFFSGFFMALYLLIQPIRVVSWMLPVTYGIQLLQNVMLRGQLPEPLLLGGLLGIGAGMFVLAWLLLRRLMASP